MTEAAVVSVALTEWIKAGEPEPLMIDRLALTAVNALREARLRPADLDAIICNTSAIPFDSPSYITTSAQHFAHRLAEKIGVDGVQAINVSAACASGSIAFAIADAMIKAGTAKKVLVAGVDNSPKGFYLAAQSVLDHDLAATIVKAIGITNPAYWAMWARRRAYDMGKPIEDIEELMAIVKSIHSEYGALNPYARYKKVFKVEEVLKSPVVCSPLHLYMICATSSGAGAAVVTDMDTARRITDKPVKVAASVVGSTVYSEPMPRLRSYMTGGLNLKEPFIEWRRVVEKAYKFAGVSSEDIDIIECHDTSTFHTINWIDQIMGWEREETDRLIRAGEIKHTGNLPVNLSGGTSSFGEAVMCQSLMMIHEIFRQIRGEAGRRQAKKSLRTGIITAYGAYGSYGCIILERGW